MMISPVEGKYPPPRGEGASKRHEAVVEEAAVESAIRTPLRGSLPQVLLLQLLLQQLLLLLHSFVSF